MDFSIVLAENHDRDSYKVSRGGVRAAVVEL